MAQHTSEPPAKRIKLDPTKTKGTGAGKPAQQVQPRKFRNVEEIRASLRVQTQEELTPSLTALRNQLTVRTHESTVGPQDERLVLVQNWLGSDPGAQDVFAIWDNATQRQTSLSALAVSVLGAILTLLSSHYTYHGLGQPIVKALLSPPWMRRLNTCLTGSHNESIIVALKLLNTLSTFAGGKEKKTVLESFPWETKSLPKLFNLRRKTQNEDSTDPLVRPDIRTLYILFIFSFLDASSSPQIKSAFLEQHRDVFLSIFKGLSQDSYSVIRKILQVCWEGIWSDAKIKRTIKIGLFSENTVALMIKLYDRVAPEDDDANHVPADLIHHFLLAICTRPGSGICFRDRGWYPRETDMDDKSGDGEDRPSKRGGIHNKILANILKTLKVNEDLRQQELALRIMGACPELVAGYWPAAALTLEPRLSSKWIANIAFFGLVISLAPPPNTSFLLANSTLFQPLPPPLWSLTENILPAVGTKINFTKGLQSMSPLVQHCSALALAKCLIKYEQVLRVLKNIESALEEDEDDGQWTKRRKELEREVRRRVPEFQVIVGFSQQKNTIVPAGTPENLTQNALLSESSQRLLWLYHCCLPDAVAEAKFDVGKLLRNFSSTPPQDELDSPVTASARLNTVRQLHVLRLLKESDQFTWSGKEVSSSKTYLFVLLKSYLATEVAATGTALKALLCHILGQSLIFQDDPDEASLWLSSLPTIRRSFDAESPDHAKLTDEGDGVITFLDDCVQRCLKTPYRYIEEKNVLIPRTTTAGTAVSPLWMTVLEQLGAKIKGKLLQPANVLAITSFCRSLLCKMLGKQEDLTLLQMFAKRIDDILALDNLFPQHPNISAAIRREVAVIQAGLSPLQNLIPQPLGAPLKDVQAFLDQAENVPVASSKLARAITASELVDWVRLVEQGQSLRPEDIARVLIIVDKHHAPALKDLSEALSGLPGLLWTALDICSLPADLFKHFSFETLFVQMQGTQLKSQPHRDMILQCVFSSTATVVEIKRAICTIGHYTSTSTDRAEITRDLLLLVASIMTRASSVLSIVQIQSLKEYIFTQSTAFKPLWIDADILPVARTGLQSLIDASLDPTSISDCNVATEIVSYWLQSLQDNLRAQKSPEIAAASPWIQYFKPDDLFDLLDVLGTAAGLSPEPAIFELLVSIMAALQRSAHSEVKAEASLRKRLGQLLSLRAILPESVLLEDMIATAVDACLPACYDGMLPTFDNMSLASLVARSETRWACHSDRLSATASEMSSFLVQKLWSKSTVRIIIGLIYCKLLSPTVVIEWLGSESSQSRSVTHLAAVISALCDSYSQRFTDEESAILASHFKRLVKELMNSSRSERSRYTCGNAVALLTATLPNKAPSFSKIFSKKLQSVSSDSIANPILAVGAKLARTLPPVGQTIVNHILEQGLQWAVEFLTDSRPQNDDTREMFDHLECLVASTSEVKVHFTETLLTAAIQNRLTDTVAIGFASQVVKVSPIKPLIVNRHLQSILQHTQFYKLCATPALTPSPIRDAVINLMYTLFCLHPWNTCQPSHVEPLVRIYRGTLSTPDRQLLLVFHMFEIQRKTSIASLLTQWSSSPELTSTNTLEAIQSLDSIQVLKTCLGYPKWRKMEDQVKVGEGFALAAKQDSQLYDPVFLALLFSQMIVDCPPQTAFAWVEMFRTNIVSLLVCSLSAKDGKMREVALHQIAALWKYMETADMQERPHVMYILNLLKDAMPPTEATSAPVRLPAYTTLLLSHALRGVFNPSNFIYPITARFLLQRPELDTTDVPMLYSMLYSSSEDWKKERTWMIRFLADGMTGTDDWKVFKRRHTWDLLSSLFQSSDEDRALRNGILEVLANLTCNAQATMSLVLKSALLTWIEMQLLAAWQPEETLAWVKILENILVMADTNKLETSIGGEWRSTICRCLSVILTSSKSASTGHLSLISGVILRLSLLAGSPVPGLPRLVDLALVALRDSEKIEPRLVLKNFRLQAGSSQGPLHRARSLHDIPLQENSMVDWGTATERLWRVCMKFQGGDVRKSAWDALTCRLLVYRSMIGDERSAIGEWARKEVLSSIGSVHTL